MGSPRFKRGEPPPQRFVEHVLSEASLADIAERWGLRISGAGWWRRKLKRELREKAQAEQAAGVPS